MTSTNQEENSYIVEGKYGKTKVRLLRVIRHDATRHDLTEVEVQCLLEGDFKESYTMGDNSRVVPTDTVKNTVYILAKESRFQCIEGLGIALCRHFIARHSHIHHVSVEMKEKLWRRVKIDGVPHDHVFTGETETRVASVYGSRNQHPDRGNTGNIITDITLRIISGIDDLRVLKTTQSGFENYVIDEFTSLQPTTDRIFCTMIESRWEFDPNNLPQDFLSVNLHIRAIMLKVFSGPPKTGEYSKSVQETMHQMAIETLKQIPQVANVTLSLPNIHHFLYDFNRFGLENNGVIFYPTDDPSGLIKCRVSRSVFHNQLLSRL